MRAALNQTFFQVGWMLENSLFLEHFFAFLDMEADVMPGALVCPKGANGKIPPAFAPQPIVWGAIEFRQVSFRYPGSEHLALENISLILRPGETIALVGENGAGKTTLIKLLARLYDPTGGQILLNGVDLREYAPEDYYRQLGVIFQDFVRYDLTVQENIGFGQTEHLDDPACLRQAAQLGGALGLIEKLPQGFSSVLGKRFEGGVDLSGGEWQKIALSRAFMRHANLLILDEPTAALDVYAESDVYSRFAELTRGKTTVFVTHRLSSVKMAQKILVLKGGHLIETGSHAELLAKDSEYARMFTLQAERYQ
jgi:ATP-binding cassette, subfamily B, bacterial